MIINFPERNMQVTPKQETRYHRGQRYTLEYDPKAPLPQRWVFVATVTRTYENIGSAATIDNAARAARKRIDTVMRIGGMD